MIVNGICTPPPRKISHPGDINFDYHNDAEPQLATDGAGTWICVWLENAAAGGKQLMFASSTDNGAHWSAPAALNGVAATVEFDFTTDGAGNWLLLWKPAFEQNVVDRDIYTSRSTDKGATWSTSTRVNSDGAEYALMYHDGTP